MHRFYAGTGSGSRYPPYQNHNPLARGWEYPGTQPYLRVGEDPSVRERKKNPCTLDHSGARSHSYTRPARAVPTGTGIFAQLYCRRRSSSEDWTRRSYTYDAKCALHRPFHSRILHPRSNRPTPKFLRGPGSQLNGTAAIEKRLRARLGGPTLMTRRAPLPLTYHTKSRILTTPQRIAACVVAGAQVLLRGLRECLLMGQWAAKVLQRLETPAHPHSCHRDMPQRSRLGGGGGGTVRYGVRPPLLWHSSLRPFLSVRCPVPGTALALLATPAVHTALPSSTFLSSQWLDCRLASPQTCVWTFYTNARSLGWLSACTQPASLSLGHWFP